MKNIILLVILSITFNCYAGFGGSRGGYSGGSRSSYSSSSRGSSSFGGSRATSNAPIVRSSTSSSRPSTYSTGTTVNHYSNGGSGNGFFTGMMIGHMMTNNSNQPIIVNGQSVAPGAQYAAPQSEGISGWAIFFWILVLSGFGFIVYKLFIQDRRSW